MNARLPSRKTEATRARNRYCFELRSELDSRVDPAALSGARARATQHIADTDTWGVSDPADGLGAAFARRRAGSLTPHLCSDSCAGALTGRHKTPPDTDGDELANIPLDRDLERAVQAEVLSRVLEAMLMRPQARGPTAP